MKQANAYLLGVDVLASRREDVIQTTPIIPIRQQMTSVPNQDGGRTVDGGGLPLNEQTPPRRNVGGRVLKSEIPGINDDDWTTFTLAMKVQAPTSISASNEFGMFAMRPRRLEDLGLMRNLRTTRSTGWRRVWIGDWVAPLSEDAFLGSARLQYKVFSTSMRRYIDDLQSGKIPTPKSPISLTLSGVLAVLHKCGPNGLIRWSQDDRFSSTKALVASTNGIF